MPTLFTLSRKDEKYTKIFEISYVIKFQPTLLLWHLLLSRRSFLVGNFHSLRRKSCHQHPHGGPPAVALGVEKRHGKVMERPPRPVDEGITEWSRYCVDFLSWCCHGDWYADCFFLAGGGVYGNECSLAPFATEADAGFSVDDCLAGDEAALSAWTSYADTTFADAQTMTFAVFIVFQLFNVLNCRSEKDSLFTLGAFQTKQSTMLFLHLDSLFLSFTCNLPDSFDWY